MGEPCVPPLVQASTNAIARLTGKVSRELTLNLASVSARSANPEARRTTRASNDSYRVDRWVSPCGRVLPATSLADEADLLSKVAARAPVPLAVVQARFGNQERDEQGLPRLNHLNEAFGTEPVRIQSPGSSTRIGFKRRVPGRTKFGSG